jgi:predicted small lipoprotein YifL
MRFASLLALALVPALAACGGSGGKVASASAKPAKTALAKQKTPVRAPLAGTPMSARVQSLPGVEGVIGAGVTDLTRRFGTPRLDVIEGDARKLQFAGTACVLDIYLYPVARGGEVQATYVDARRASDGQDVDRAACIAALRKG